MTAHNDTAFLRMFLLVLGGLVAFTVIIAIMASLISGSLEEIKAGDSMRQAAITKRIAPVGNVNLAGTQMVKSAAAPAAPAAKRSGAEVYQAACMACHMTGAAGAPKTGDKAAWEPRLGVGMDQLVASAINGKGAMPPRGGNPATTDEEIRAAVVHMLNETGVDANVGGATSATADDAQTAAAGVVAAGQAMVGAAADSVQGTSAGVADTGSAPPAASTIEADLTKGKAVYQMACFVCHGTGAAGAPKLGDKGAWAPRIAQGSEMLLKNAINGKGAMPPKGGRMDLSDTDMLSSVAYMVTESQ